MYTLIATAKLNGVDPQAWLADVLRRIADHPASQLQPAPLALEAPPNLSRSHLTIAHHGPGRMLTPELGVRLIGLRSLLVFFEKHPESGNA